MQAIRRNLPRIGIILLTAPGWSIFLALVVAVVVPGGGFLFAAIWGFSFVAAFFGVLITVISDSIIEKNKLTTNVDKNKFTPKNLQ